VQQHRRRVIDRTCHAFPKIAFALGVHEVKWCIFVDIHTSLYDTIRYCVFNVKQKKDIQLSLPHGTNKKCKRKTTKIN